MATRSLVTDIAKKNFGIGGPKLYKLKLGLCS